MFPAAVTSEILENMSFRLCVLAGEIKEEFRFFCFFTLYHNTSQIVFFSYSRLGVKISGLDQTLFVFCRGQYIGGSILEILGGASSSLCTREQRSLGDTHTVQRIIDNIVYLQMNTQFMAQVWNALCSLVLIDASNKFTHHVLLVFSSRECSGSVCVLSNKTLYKYRFLSHKSV